MRSEHEKIARRRVLYPGINVHANKLGIRNHAELEAIERELSGERAAQGLPRSFVLHGPPAIAFSPTQPISNVLGNVRAIRRPHEYDARA